MEHSQVIDLTEKPFRVGPWIVAPDRHEWRAGDDVRRVPPRLMLLLRCLARAGGKTVSRESLLEIVWDRRVLNDEVLSRSIADLRQALDDDAREPRFVKTIPKLGYCLIAELQFNLSDQTKELADIQRNDAGYPEQIDVNPIAANSAGTIAIADPGPVPALSSVKPARSRASLRRGLVLAAFILLALILTWLGYGAWSPAVAPAIQLDADALLRARPLTSTSDLEFSPRFSRDGQWIAYASAAPTATTSQLVLRSRDGTAQRQFTQQGDASDVCPVFVGNDLIWTRHNQGRCQLLRQALLADAPNVLAACAPIRSCPDVSPDSKYLVFTDAAIDAEHGHGLASLDLRSGQHKVLTTPLRRMGHDVDPRFSKLSQLSFVRGEDVVQSLWQLAFRPDAAKPAQPQRVPLADAMIFGQAYLPDGRLLLASDVLGFRALLQFKPDQPLAATNPRLLGARGARFPDVAPDGSVVFEIASYDANLWLYRGDAKPIRLTPSSRYESNPVLSADGKNLIYQSNQRGYEAIFSIQLDAEKPLEQPLPLDGESRWAHPAFAATSDDLWLTRYGAHATEVWRYRASARRAEQVSGFPLGAHDVSDDAQNDSLWYLVGEAPSVQLMRRASANDANDELIASDVLSYRTDTRGLFLSYQHAPNQLWHCPTPPDLRACVRLPIAIARGYARHWALSDRGLYFVAQPTPGETVRVSSRFDFATHKVTTLNVPAPSTPAQGLAVARDESIIVIATLDDLAIDLHAWLAPKSDDR